MSFRKKVRINEPLKKDEFLSYDEEYEQRIDDLHLKRCRNGETCVGRMAEACMDPSVKCEVVLYSDDDTGPLFPEHDNSVCCGACRHFRMLHSEANGWGDIHGECRRHAPSPLLALSRDFGKSEFIDQGSEIIIWPLMFCEDWCGDWEKHV